jgi:hypothetical protein
MGAVTEHILAAMNRVSVEEIDLGDIERLIGLGTAIKDGDTTVDEAFPAPSVATVAQEAARAALAKSQSQSKATQATTVPTGEPKPTAELIHEVRTLGKEVYGFDWATESTSLARYASQGAVNIIEDLNAAELGTVKAKLLQKEGIAP